MVVSQAGGVVSIPTVVGHTAALSVVDVSNSGCSVVVSRSSVTISVNCGNVILGTDGSAEIVSVVDLTYINLSVVVVYLASGTAVVEEVSILVAAMGALLLVEYSVQISVG